MHLSSAASTSPLLRKNFLLAELSDKSGQSKMI